MIGLIVCIVILIALFVFGGAAGAAGAVGVGSAIAGASGGVYSTKNAQNSVQSGVQGTEITNRNVSPESFSPRNPSIRPIIVDKSQRPRGKKRPPIQFNEAIQVRVYDKKSGEILEEGREVVNDKRE